MEWQIKSKYMIVFEDADEMTMLILVVQYVTIFSRLKQPLKNQLTRRNAIQVKPKTQNLSYLYDLFL